HQYATVRFGRYSEAPQHRLGERIFHRPLLRRISARRAERFVVLYQQYFGPDTPERNQPAAAFLAAIEPEIVRSQSGRESTCVQEFRIKTRDLDVEIAAALIPVEREIA